MLRRLIRHPRSQAAIAALIALYLTLVDRTTRWTLRGADGLAAAREGDTGPAGGLILAFWHEQVAIAPACWRQLARFLAAPHAHVLVSRHRDGRLIGAVAGRFDLAMVYASSTRGGAEGLRALTRLLRAGDIVVITPDGPRGPRREAAPGVAQLAALSGRPILPCGAATSRTRTLRSWDRMTLPLPFARGVLVVGPPILVPRDGAATALPAIAAALTAAREAALAEAEARSPGMAAGMAAA
jgi:hypothetical protein